MISLSKWKNDIRLNVKEAQQKLKVKKEAMENLTARVRTLFIVSKIWSNGLKKCSKRFEARSFQQKRKAEENKANSGLTMKKPSKNELDEKVLNQVFTKSINGKVSEMSVWLCRLSVGSDVRWPKWLFLDEVGTLRRSKMVDVEILKDFDHLKNSAKKSRKSRKTLKKSQIWSNHDFWPRRSRLWIDGSRCESIESRSKMVEVKEEGSGGGHGSSFRDVYVYVSIIDFHFLVLLLSSIRFV